MSNYNLGFATHLVSAGSREPRVWNSGPWAKRVGDRRNFLKYFDGLTHKHIITSIDFDTEGCLMTLVRSIVGRSGDSRSVWVYIPNTIKITAEELCQVHSFAQRVLLAKEGELDSEIDALTKRNYPEADFCPAYEASTSTAQKYAIRYLNTDYTLEELFGSLYQRYYTVYKGVFFIDKQAGLSLTAEASSVVEDLTHQRLERYGILLPPSIPPTADYRIYHNEVLFNKALHVKIGEHITLTAKRNGFDSQDFKMEVLNATTKCSLPDAIKWKRTIKHNDIRVKNHKDRDLDATIRIGNTILHSKVTLTEEQLKNAQVEVSCDGYSTQKLSLRQAMASAIMLIPKPTISRTTGQSDETEQGSILLGFLLGLVLVGCSAFIYIMWLSSLGFSGIMMAIFAVMVTGLAYLTIFVMKKRNNSAIGSLIGVLLGVLIWQTYFAFIVDYYTLKTPEVKAQDYQLTTEQAVSLPVIDSTTAPIKTDTNLVEKIKSILQKQKKPSKIPKIKKKSTPKPKSKGVKGKENSTMKVLYPPHYKDTSNKKGSIQKSPTTNLL